MSRASHLCLKKKQKKLFEERSFYKEAHGDRYTPSDPQIVTLVVSLVD